MKAWNKTLHEIHKVGRHRSLTLQ